MNKTPSRLESRLKEPDEAKILVTGIARDCGKKIEQDINRIALCLTRFREIHWLVVESDSEDNTVEILQEHERRLKNFRYLSLGRLRDKYPKRTERTSFCRNVYLGEVQKNEIYTDIDFVLVVDLDGINTKITEEGILSCWEVDDWGGCAANQAGPYYDVWALRHEVWCPGDCWHEYYFLREYGLGVARALYASVYSKMITIPSDQPMFEVDSAFGGAAIYKREALMNAKYVGVDEEGKEVCDHVALSEDMRNDGFKLYLNPKFVNSGITFHSRRSIQIWTCLKLYFGLFASRLNIRQKNNPNGEREASA